MRSLVCVCAVKNHVPVVCAAKSTGFDADQHNPASFLCLFTKVTVEQQVNTLGETLFFFFFLVHVLALTATGALLSLQQLFSFMNQFQCEFSIRAAYRPSHYRHAYQATFPSCLWGNRGPKWAKVSHIESRFCQQAQCAHAQRKYAAQYFYYSPCQAGALVTQDNRRFVACSSRRFIPEFTICLAEMRLWGGWTTLTQHLIAATVALLLICILVLCRLADFCMITHKCCNCCNSEITRCKKLSVLMCAELCRKSVHLQVRWCLLLSVCRGQKNHSALTRAKHTSQGRIF